MSQVAPADSLRCVNHPERATRVRCSSCGRPICPKCMRESAVGMKCPDCSRQPRRAVHPGSRRYVAAAAAGFGTAALIGLVIGTGLIGPLRILGILLPLLAGFVVGEVVTRMANRLGGTVFQSIAALSTVAGLGAGFLLVSRSVAALLNPTLLVFMALAAIVAAVRVGR